MKMKYEDMGGRPFVLVPVIDERPAVVPLDAMATLTYGYLVFLSRKATGSSRSAISTTLRLDRQAVKKALATLMEGGLVEEDTGTVRAVAPQGRSREWFRFKKTKSRCDEWQDEFIYDRVYLPRSSTVISVKANLLFWHLVKLGHAVDRMPGYLQVGGHPQQPPQYLTAQYLAHGLRCYRRTVSSGLNRLMKLGLITIQRTGRNSFVVGIPPIATKADLWRDTWKRSRVAEAAVTEITASSLFAVPSRDTLTPSVPEDAGASLFMRGYGIKGRIAEEIVTKIVKHQIPPRNWQPLLAEAKRDHDRNSEKNPDMSAVKHCGYLFKYILEEFKKQEDARITIAQRHTCAGYHQTEGLKLLAEMRLTAAGSKLLRSALGKEQLELRDGGCVPCRLNWEHVCGVLQRAGNNLKAFKQSIVEYIFDLSGKPPECDWYDAWMATEQIPVNDNRPMVALGLSGKEIGYLRTHATLLAQRRYSKDDVVAHGHLVNHLIRLGCWQASSRSVPSIEASIDVIGQLVLPKKATEG